MRHRVVAVNSSQDMETTVGGTGQTCRAIDGGWMSEVSCESITRPVIAQMVTKA